MGSLQWRCTLKSWYHSLFSRWFSARLAADLSVATTALIRAVKIQSKVFAGRSPANSSTSRESYFWQKQKINNGTAVGSAAPLLGADPEGWKPQRFWRHMGGSVCDSQQSRGWKQLQWPSSDGQTNIMWHTMEISLKKEKNSVTCYDPNEPWGNCAKLNKPVAKNKYSVSSLMWGII